jgi:hypothetical protein
MDVPNEGNWTQKLHSSDLQPPTMQKRTDFQILTGFRGGERPKGISVGWPDFL